MKEKLAILAIAISLLAIGLSATALRIDAETAAMRVEMMRGC